MREHGAIAHDFQCGTIIEHLCHVPSMLHRDAKPNSLYFQQLGLITEKCFLDCIDAVPSKDIRTRIYILQCRSIIPTIPPEPIKIEMNQIGYSEVMKWAEKLLF